MSRLKEFDSRNNEYIPQETEEGRDVRRREQDSGFSESKLAKIVEGSQVDLSTLKTNKAFQALVGKEKTLAAFQAISGRLIELVCQYLELQDTDLHHAQRLNDEITKVRGMQRILLTRIFGKLNEEDKNGEREEELNKLFFK